MNYEFPYMGVKKENQAMIQHGCEFYWAIKQEEAPTKKQLNDVLFKYVQRDGVWFLLKGLHPIRVDKL